MTISSQTRTAGPFFGNGITTVLPFYFKIFAAKDLLVVREETATSVSSDLTLTQDYTVVLNADQDENPGGSVTLLTALADGFQVVLASQMEYLQPLDLTNQGGFYPNVINAAFDRVTILLQQLNEIASRSLRFPVSDTGANTQLPQRTTRANNLLGFDGNGNPVAVAPAAQSATALQALLSTPGGAALVNTSNGLNVEQRLAEQVTAGGLAEIMAGGTVDVFASGAPMPGVAARFQATEAITAHAHYAFLDNSTITYSGPGFQAHASFNSNVKIEGVEDSDHHHDFQSYTHHNAGGTLSRFSSFWSQLDHTGVGTIVEASLFKANNPLGTGPIANLYGVYIAPLTRGTVNYAVYAPGTTVSHFGGALLLGQVATPSYVMYNPNSGNLDLLPRTGYGVAVGGQLLFGADTGAPAKIAYNLSGNLDITPRTGYHTSITDGSLLVGAALPAAGEKLHVSANTTDYIARMYNAEAVAPKGLALVYTGAAPNGTGSEFVYCQDSVGIRMKVLSNGNLQNTNNSYGALSDVKLKENIVDATPKLDDLMQVRVVNYNLRSDPDQKQLGVIAQELAEVFPGMIEETPDYEDVEVAPARVDTTMLQRQKTVKREEVHYEPQLVDGQWRQVPTTIMVDAPLYEDHPLFDEHGAPLMELVEAEQPEVRGEDGEITQPFKAAVYRQRIHRVAVMEEVPHTIDVPAKFERRPTGTTTKSVKYSIFVPMLIKAIQELNAMVRP